jgi:hypothetical protein
VVCCGHATKLTSSLVRALHRSAYRFSDIDCHSLGECASACFTSATDARLLTCTIDQSSEDYVVTGALPGYFSHMTLIRMTPTTPLPTSNRSRMVSMRGWLSWRQVRKHRTIIPCLRNYDHESSFMGSLCVSSYLHENTSLTWTLTWIMNRMLRR